MSDIVTGFVAKITEKKAGKGTVYNLCIECDDTGKEEWFGHGFDKPQCFEGDEIEFEVEMNGDYANVNVDTLVITKEGDGGEQKQSNRNSRGNGRGRSGRNSGGSSRGGRGGSSRGGTGGSRSGSRGGSRSGSGGNGKGMSKDDYWNQKAEADKEKDERISRHGAYNTAIAFVQGALAEGAVKLPSKAADKLDAYTALVDEEYERIHALLQEEVGEYEPQQQEQEEEEEAPRRGRGNGRRSRVPE